MRIRERWVVFDGRESVRVGVLLLITLALRFVFLAGPVGSDDTRYMDAAWKLAHGEPPGVLDHAYVRAAYIIWLAAWTRLGAGGTAFLASQLVVNVGLVLALYWLGRKLTGDSRAAFLGALCWALFPVELTYAGAVLPDQLAVLLGLLGSALSLTALRAPTVKPLALAGAGVLCGLAGSVKEPYAIVPLILGLWTLWEIRPLRAGLERLAVISAVAGCTFALEYPFFEVWTGDWLYRHRALEPVYGAGGAAHVQGSVLYWGTFVYYVKDVLLNAAVSGLFGWLVLIASLRALGNVREWRFIGLWSLSFFAFLQYGSTTLSRYQPLPMQPRYIQPMIILLFIPLGRWLSDLSASPQFGRLGVALLLVGVSAHGMTVAEASSARGLYFATFPRAVERTLTMQAQGLIGRVAIPEIVQRKIPPDLRLQTAHWPKVDLTGIPTTSQFEELRQTRAAVLIPNDWPKLHHWYREFATANGSATSDDVTLIRWLGRRAPSVPVEDGQTFLDRFWLATGVKALQRRATRVVIGRLYLLAD